VIPLKDMTPRRSFPVVTVLLIIANFVVFFHQISMTPRAGEAFVMEYGMVPAKIQYALAGTHRVTLQQAGETLFTCMFLHGGWLHIIGNMWFLWIFGGNVEDRFGAPAYALFYIVCGIGSSVSQLLFTWGSHVPSIGASGAISGVLGAYIVFFPRSRILTLVTLFIIFFLARIPAIIFIGLWFLIQFLSGVGSLGANGAAGAGVAWWAHVGGFLLGMFFAVTTKGLTGNRGESSPEY
jgi:membrane associated rhomboid family serine protease